MGAATENADTAATGTRHNRCELRASATMARSRGRRKAAERRRWVKAWERNNVEAGGADEIMRTMPLSQLLEKAGLGLMRWR